MSNIMIPCPKCKTENPIDIFKAKEGSRILCRGCNASIILRFKGKPPEQILEDIQDLFPKYIKVELG